MFTEILKKRPKYPQKISKYPENSKYLAKIVVNVTILTQRSRRFTYCGRISVSWYLLQVTTCLGASVQQEASSSDFAILFCTS